MVASTSTGPAAALPRTAVVKPSGGEQISNALKFAANVGVLPGTSQIVEGDVGRGLLYAGGGLLTGYLLPGALGPLGWVAIGLDAFSMSASGRHLWELGRLPRISVRVGEDHSQTT